MSLSIEGITDADVVDTINNASSADMENYSILHFILHWLLIVAIPGIIVIYLCCCATTKDKKTLSDITQEQLDAQQEVAHAIEMVNPTELHTQTIARLIPPAPSETAVATATTGASTSQQQQHPPQQQEQQQQPLSISQEKSSSTKEETTPKVMELTYDKESKMYGWSMDASSSSKRLKRRKQNSNAQCSICLESFESTTMQAASALFISPCHHLFHKECIVGGWIQQQNKDECPYCRQPLWDNSVYEEIQGQVALELYKNKNREINGGNREDNDGQQENNSSAVAVAEGQETTTLNTVSLESGSGDVEEGNSHNHVEDDDVEEGHLATTVDTTDERCRDLE